MEILRWSERVQDRDQPMGKKKNPVFLLLLSLDTSLTRHVMHIGGWCLDLRVISSLCCKRLEWCRCNHAWPFKIACGQWLALCWVLCLQASLPGVSRHRDQGEAQMFPVALPSFIVSLPVFTAAWYDLTPCTQHSRPFLVWLVLYTHRWRWGMSGLSDADAGCQLLLRLFTSAHTARCAFKWPDILPYSEMCSIFVSLFVWKYTSDQSPYIIWKECNTAFHDIPMKLINI